MASGKQHALEIFLQTLSSINIPRMMEWKLPLRGTQLILPECEIELAQVSRICVVAVGKAAHAMVNGLLNILPGHIPCSGIVAAPTTPPHRATNFEYFLAGHPIPNADSLNAAEAALRFLQETDECTLVFFLLSGGGSALFEKPLIPAMSLEDVQAMHRTLVTCGAPIEAMNAVRRHLSAVKGGRLALAASRATKITLAVTDVPSGKEYALASGPSLPDPSTADDVLRIVSQYNLHGKLPQSLVRWLEAGQMPETPKPGHPAFANNHFVLLLGLDDLFHAAHHAVEAKGYIACCDNSTDDWQVEEAAANLLAQLEAWQSENRGQRVAIIADGEVSSPVTGSGTGGRNSAFVLACVERIAGRKITVLSAGTDGIDGNSPAAGAVADADTLSRARALKLDPAESFAQSDAYTFFRKLDDAVVTGPTGNNLRDLRILLAEP
jgi:hydroxypyruvate reductase